MKEGKQKKLALIIPCVFFFTLNLRFGFSGVLGEGRRKQRFNAESSSPSSDVYILCFGCKWRLGEIMIERGSTNI